MIVKRNEEGCCPDLSESKELADGPCTLSAGAVPASLTAAPCNGMWRVRGRRSTPTLEHHHHHHPSAPPLTPQSIGTLHIPPVLEHPLSTTIHSEDLVPTWVPTLWQSTTPVLTLPSLLWIVYIIYTFKSTLNGAHVLVLLATYRALALFYAN